MSKHGSSSDLRLPPAAEASNGARRGCGEAARHPGVSV